MEYQPFQKSMLALGQAPSVIRETFEYGLRRSKEIGRENVFDFSLGNPSVPAPDSVHGSIRRLMDEVPTSRFPGARPCRIRSGSIGERSRSGL